MSDEAADQIAAMRATMDQSKASLTELAESVCGVYQVFRAAGIDTVPATQMASHLWGVVCHNIARAGEPTGSAS